MRKTRVRSEVKIYWNDAVIYGSESEARAVKLSNKITTGILLRENKDFILIKNPRTLVLDNKTGKWKTHKQSAGATYFYIPCGMILKKER